MSNFDIITAEISLFWDIELYNKTSRL